MYWHTHILSYWHTVVLTYCRTDIVPYWCIVQLLYCCTAILMYSPTDVLLHWHTDVPMYFCSDVLVCCTMYWRAVILMCCTDVQTCSCTDVLLYWRSINSSIFQTIFKSHLFVCFAFQVSQVIGVRLQSLAKEVHNSRLNSRLLCQRPGGHQSRVARCPREVLRPDVDVVKLFSPSLTAKHL